MSKNNKKTLKDKKLPSWKFGLSPVLPTNNRVLWTKCKKEEINKNTYQII